MMLYLAETVCLIGSGFLLPLLIHRVAQDEARS